jgi:hypothetical protein
MYQYDGVCLSIEFVYSLIQVFPSIVINSSPDRLILSIIDIATVTAEALEKSRGET